MRLAIAIVTTVVASAAMLFPDGRDDSRVQDAHAADPLALPGYAAYVKHCAPCHGERGDGKGVAARFLDPPPRDFAGEPFRLVSGKNGVPLPKDIFEAAATGIGGTAMIPFASIGEDVLWNIVEVVEAFRVQGLTRRLANGGLSGEALEKAVASRRPERRDQEEPEPPETHDSAARGLVHYRALCASCHGVDGRGVMPASVPEGVRRERPRDLARGVLKQIPTAQNLFARIRCGMPGTAMPATDRTTLDASRVWELVHYLRTLIPDGAQLLASPDARTLDAVPLEGDVPTSPDDPRFRAAPLTWVAFAPFRDAAPGPPGAFVQALAGDRVLAFRFTVPDATRDDPATDAGAAPDGIAVRVTAAPDPPVLPFPGQVPKVDRAVFLNGPLPDGRTGSATAAKFENPENVCRMVQPPDRAGAGRHESGAWHVVMAVRTDESGPTRGGAPLRVSFAAFDGSLRRGPMPVAYSSWQRLVVR